MKSHTKAGLLKSAEEGDLFKGVLGKGIDLKKVTQKAKNIFEIPESMN